MTAIVGASPPTVLQFFDNRGVPAAGGSVLTQVSSVNYVTYQDAAGATPLPNPIPLNSRGEVSNASGVSCQLFLVSGVTYTFTLYDSAGNQLNQATSMQGLVGNTSLSASSGSSLVGFIQSGTGAVARTVQDKDREIISVTDFMTATQKSDAKARTYGQDCTAAFQNALDSVSTGGKVIVPWGGYLISDTLAPSNGTAIIGDNRGDSLTATAIKFTGSGKPCFLIGASSSTFNYNNMLHNMYIELTQQDSTGVKLYATVGALLQRLRIEGQAANLGTRTTVAIDIDGWNYGAFFNTIRDVQSSHIHTGLFLHTTGSTSPTQQQVDGFSHVGDKGAGDTTSKGIYFVNSGESTVITGGDLEDCGVGVQQDGLCDVSAFNSFGLRFEGNTTDLQLNATGATGQVVMLGSSTLNPAKINDNSGHTRNVIQYGIAGTVGVTGVPVTGGYVTINGSQDNLFTATMNGAVAGTTPFHYSVFGKNVTLTLPTFKPAGNSSNTPITITGLPAAIYPVNDIWVTFPKVTDNGSYVNLPGAIRITAAGGITIFENSSGGSFTSSTNSTGWDGFSISYTTA